MHAKNMIQRSWHYLSAPAFGLENVWFSLLGIAGLALGAWTFGLFTKYFAVFLAVYVLMVWYWFWKFRALSEGDQGHLEAKLAMRGQLLAAVLYALLGLYGFWRVSGALPISALLAGWFIAGWWVLRPLISEGPQTQRLMMRFFVIGTSIFLGWIVSSLAYDPLTLRLISSPDPLPSSSVFEHRLQVKREQAKDVRIGLALSGGGYRAASIHAGVLKVLEQHQIPIDYLSTVSGGSIVGSYYALGHSSDEFQSLLQNKPGLPNHLFHLGYLLGELVTPWWRNSDTYASHFRNAYFGDARLGDVRQPVLVVNVTDYRSGDREVLTSDRPTTKDIPIAEAVAASGAFPGAFEPKTIGDMQYIDGGVVDNLGLEGLRKYLMGASQKPDLDILIVSDASKAPTLQEPNKKEFIITLLQEASSHSYEALHIHLYRQYSNNQYEQKSIPNGVQPFFQNMSHIFGEQGKHDEYLFVFVLDGTSKGEREYMEQAGREKALEEGSGQKSPLISQHTAKNVAEFSTLEELTPIQFQQGLWVGETISRRYADVIGCTVRFLQEKKAAHRPIDPDEVLLSCGT